MSFFDFFLGALSGSGISLVLMVWVGWKRSLKRLDKEIDIEDRMLAYFRAKLLAIRAYYSEDLFPVHGETVDCRSAIMARWVLDLVRKEIAKDYPEE